MQSALAVFLITLGLGQLISTGQGLRAASLVGPNRLAGYSLGGVLLLSGSLILPPAWIALAWTIPAGPLALGVLLLAGSFLAPPLHPNHFFDPGNPDHGGCRAVKIPHGTASMPGLLLTPLPSLAGSLKKGGAVCIIPGAGDTKTSFKWRLVQALLAEGLTVLTIDPPGHGDYRHRPMEFPDCLSAVPAAIYFLRQQPGIDRVGLVGISLGGALAMASLAQWVTDKTTQVPQPGSVDALVVLETPVGLKYNRVLFYREFWQAISRAPVLSLLGEISVKQMRESWYTGGYYSRHRSTAELIDLLDPPASLARLQPEIPVLLVYSRHDPIATPAAARLLQQAAPRAHLIEAKKASHVTLTLLPEVNRQVAQWLTDKLKRV